ncbi:MAG: 2-amino-4-hydroxy-6-hydroxymethyldihydropteridine diphosphokinase [Acidocella sp.]|nr:2-amino-4-hydroxy-6-hydroxymethyldihydropteridine diphosphokinase [Acidocella sp.]
MILIAIGANLPLSKTSTVIDTCQAAIIALRQIRGLSLVATSPWYRTAAIPAGDQPDYCNGIARFRGAADPVALLAELHRIEAEFGRQRSVRNAARTLDLDIIDLNGLIRGSAPMLPHPSTHRRAFVLQPIIDIAPAWRHPILRETAASLLSDLAPQTIRPWFDSVH